MIGDGLVTTERIHVISYRGTPPDADPA